MRPLGAMIGPIALLLAGCGPSERAPPPYFVIPPGPTAESGAPAPRAPGHGPSIPAPNPEIQRFLPGPSAEDIQRGPAPVPRPSPAPGPTYTPPYNGPITGYGPGGMAQPPGAPPNPPYPRGGLMPVP